MSEKVKFVFQKKAGQTYHLDDEIQFFGNINDCKSQETTTSHKGYEIDSDEVRVLKNFKITIEVG